MHGYNFSWVRKRVESEFGRERVNRAIKLRLNMSALNYLRKILVMYRRTSNQKYKRTKWNLRNIEKAFVIVCSSTFESSNNESSLEIFNKIFRRKFYGREIK